jgi:glycosyltransferase involved in cell wall biosynthesis
MLAIASASPFLQEPFFAMRVLLISTSYPRTQGDWRGIFILHQAASLARADGIELTIWAPPGDLPDKVRAVATPQESAWLGALMEAGGISHLMRSGGAKALFAPIRLLRYLSAAYRRDRDVDLYHINWLQSALPLPADGKPALITVLGNDLKLLRLPFMRTLLRRVMRHRAVAICPNADWMVAPLHDAFGDLATIVPVSFGIDPRWYAIERVTAAKTPMRWLAVTRLTQDKLGPLFEWSEALFRDSSRELHLFGPMQEGLDVPTWVHYHGPATPAQLAEEWFPQACGIITLSRHAEGRPQVMLESMASGLPIVASRMPAHASLVIDGDTGRLVGSQDEYVNAVQEIEHADANRRFGEAARSRMRAEVGTWDDCAGRYIRLYRQLQDGMRG